MHDISVAAPGHMSCAPQSGTLGFNRVNTSNKGKNRGKLVFRSHPAAAFHPAFPRREGRNRRIVSCSMQVAPRCGTCILTNSLRFAPIPLRPLATFRFRVRKQHPPAEVRPNLFTILARSPHSCPSPGTNTGGGAKIGSRIATETPQKYPNRKPEAHQNAHQSPRAGKHTGSWNRIIG